MFKKINSRNKLNIPHWATLLILAVICGGIFWGAGKVYGDHQGCDLAYSDPTPTLAPAEWTQWHRGDFFYKVYEFRISAPGSEDIPETPPSWPDGVQQAGDRIRSNQCGSSETVRIDNLALGIEAGEVRPDAAYFGVPASLHNNGGHYLNEDPSTTPQIPDDPPSPKMHNNLNRAVAYTDDGGFAKINNRMLWCTDYREGGNTGEGCDYDPFSSRRSPFTPPGSPSNPDWSKWQLAGHLFAANNCPHGAQDKRGKTLNCNSNQFLNWYKQYGLTSGGNLSLTNTIGRRGDGSLRDFHLHMRAVQTYHDGFSTRFTMTFRYPLKASITGDKVNIDNNSRNGAFSNNRISVDRVGNTTSNPYNFKVNSGRNYTVRAQDGPNEWKLEQVCISNQNNGRCRSTNGVETVSVPHNDNVNVRWRYRRLDWDLDGSLSPVNFTSIGVEPGKDYYMNYRVTNNGEWTSSRYTMEVRTTDGADNINPNFWRWRNRSRLNPGRSNAELAKFRVKENAQDGDRVCFRGFAFPEHRDGGVDRSNRVCTRVRLPREPYMSTNDGSIHAGATYDSEPCLLPPDSSTFIQGNTEGTTGSKADFIASAGGSIKQFGSAGRADRNNLTFGNSGRRGFYGVICRPDVFNELFGSAESVTANTQAEARNFLTRPTPETLIVNYDGNLTLNGPIEIKKGRHVTLVVNGSIHINRSGTGAGITYDNGPYQANGRVPAVQEVPSLALVARNNVRVDNSVTRLDGIYYTGTEGREGIIDTCGNSPVGSGPSITSPNNAADNCDNRLTVNGTLVANKIHFRRTVGDVNKSTAPAETINFFAQTYLQPPPGFNLLLANIRHSGERPPVF